MNLPRPSAVPAVRRGFTLVELLVSTVVLSVLLLVTLTSLDSMQRSWRSSKARVDQFRDARVAFETITRTLSQATLNTYWDYYYSGSQSNLPAAGSTTPPAGYVRQSELHFITGSARGLGPADATQAEYPSHSVFFQAPLGHSELHRGLAGLLNSRGYYIQFDSDVDRRPSFLPAGVTRTKFRHRLMEYRPPAENAAVNGRTLQGNTVYSTPQTWYKTDLEAASRPLADNIVLLIISPQVAPENITIAGRQPWWIAPGYRYNSRDRDNSTEVVDPIVVDSITKAVRQGTQHMLPPQLRVTLVAVDEESAARWMQVRNDTAVDLQVEADAPFEQALHYERDLERVRTYLTGQRLNFRVFTSVITLRNAAWDSRTF